MERLQEGRANTRGLQSKPGALHWLSLSLDTTSSLCPPPLWPLLPRAPWATGRVCQPLCSPSSCPGAGLCLSLSRPFPALGLAPGPSLAHCLRTRSHPVHPGGGTREPPTPISLQRLGLQVPDPALGRINVSAHKRSQQGCEGQQEGGRGRRGHTSWAVRLRRPERCPHVQGCPLPTSPRVLGELEPTQNGSFSRGPPSLPPKPTQRPRPSPSRPDCSVL